MKTRQEANLVIRVHLTDGTVESFKWTDASSSKKFLEEIQPTHLFLPPRLVIAGEYSKSVFVTSQIIRVDFIHEANSWWQFPGGYSDMVELSEDDFRKYAHLDSPEQMIKRHQSMPVDNFLVSFLKLRMVGGRLLFLMIEVPLKLPIENHSFMKFLISKGSFPMRLKGGGMGVVNLANLLAYTTYPGVPQIPADSWLAEPILNGAGK